MWLRRCLRDAGHDLMQRRQIPIRDPALLRGSPIRRFSLLWSQGGCTKAGSTWFFIRKQRESAGIQSVSHTTCPPSATPSGTTLNPTAISFSPLSLSPATMSSQPLVLRSNGNLFKGTKGNRRDILSNTFKLQLPDKDYYHYDREHRRTAALQR